MSRILCAALALSMLGAAACAPAVEPIRVRSSELKTLPSDAVPGRPVIIEFAEGDVIPIDLTFAGELIELTPPAPGLAFRARRRFFVRVGADGLSVSTDGVTFGKKPAEPGSFRLGLSVKPEGARVEVNVKTPKFARAPE